jgi:glutamate-1-semialdehyde 2,1-aminomutase
MHLSLPAGTLSGNPLAMTAGIKTLEILDRPGSYEHLDKVTARLVAGIMAAAKEAGHAITGGHISGELAARASYVLHIW